MERRSFKEGFLADLKMRVDLVGLVGKYSEISRRSGRFWARCPFHFEKTPSFCIYNEEGVYKCFGCGESGDAITFVQKMDGLDFMSAVEKLADSVNMQIIYADNSVAMDYTKQLKEKKEILAVISEAVDFYINELYKPTSVVAQRYIKERKLNKKSLDDFSIGYSRDFNSLINHLKNNYSEKLLIDSGLASEGNGKIYDVQAERLVFPIKNQMGQVVGFSGRILTDNKDLAKYKNTRSTMVFDKSKLVFGLYQAIKSKGIDKFNFTLLVEGQIDVIMLHQNGFNNAVATLGTAFTEGHAIQLKRINKNVVVCYDGDSAGQKATMKAADILNNAGLKVRIAQLPIGMDPDEFIKINGREEFEKILNQAEEIYDYKLRKWAEEMNISSNFDKTDYIKKAISLVASLPTTAEAELYLPIIKKYTNVPIDALRESLQRQKQASFNQLNITENEEIVQDLFIDAYQKADKFILASLLYKKPYVNDICCLELEFVNPDYQKIYDKILEKQNCEKPYRISDLYDDFDIENNKLVKDIVFFNFSDDDEINKKYFIESINQNEILKLKKISDNIEQQYNASKDLQERSQLARELMAIKLKLKEKSKK